MIQFLSIFGLILMGSMTPAFADGMQEVMDLTSDANHGEIYHFAVLTDIQGDLTGIAYFETNKVPRTFSLDQIHSGVVLLHDNSHNLDVVILTAPTLSSKDGGEVHMNYLSNGITHKRPDRYYQIELARSGSRWATYRSREADSALFTHMFLKANFLPFIGKVGISRIDTY